MQRKKITQFVQSFILLPTAFASISLGGLPVNQAKDVQIAQINIVTERGDMQAKADAIDAYFEARDMPLKGLGMKMVVEADKNDLDWRLLPAIAIRESSGGKNKCQKVEHSFFGWGSCKIGFNSDEEAIEVVAKNLGGKNPNTAHHYDNKTTKEILLSYNPRSIVRYYPEQVMKIMDAIGPEEISILTKMES